jgi:hypothetical protein
MTEFQKYIQRYTELIPSENWIEELKNSGTKTLEIYSQFSEKQGDFSYSKGKWNLKELLQHLIDAERIFAYRALRFARKDKTELTGWNEEEYSKQYFSDLRTLKNLLEEFEAVRKSSILLFETFSSSVLSETGIANKNEISVETLGKLIVGHNIHHLNIIKEKYLTKM